MITDKLYRLHLHLSLYERNRYENQICSILRAQNGYQKVDCIRSTVHSFRTVENCYQADCVTCHVKTRGESSISKID